MDNPRAEKVAIVDEVRERLDGADAVMVAEYRGLSVAALAELRRSLRPAGGRFKIYKNTLVRRAAAEADAEFVDLLVGPTALAFTEQTPEGDAGDVVSVAKALRDFARTHPDLVVKGGIFEGNFIDADGLKQLADIEPREVLLAKLAGAMAAPMTQLAALMQALPRDLAYGLKALADQGGASDAPADEAEAVAEEPAAEAEEPVAEEPVAEEPAAEEPVAEEPAAESTEEEPTESSEAAATEEE